MLQKSTLSESPTIQLYGALDQAFAHFNQRLFGGKLPPCVITLRSSNHVRGYHHSGRFISLSGDIGDELGLHPGYFAVHPVEVALSTLVHEMVHHWQEHFGRPSSSNPHNRDWVTKMISIGLMPSHNGLPGGRQTGRAMTHFILPDGAFATACEELVRGGFRLPWMDRHAPVSAATFADHQEALKSAGIEFEMSPAPLENLNELTEPDPVLFDPPAKRERTKFMFSCPNCATRAWAGYEAHLLCGDCDTILERKE